MKTSAYSYADAEVNPLNYAPNVDDNGDLLPSGYSKELDLLAKIDRFGVQAILGRNVLYLGELRAMIFAENILYAYRERHRSENWAEWADKHPHMAKLFFEIEGELR